MEERGQPPDAATGAADDDINEDPASATAETQLVPFGPTSESKDTYVIHFPKDQIYRVPAPENATHRPVSKKKKSRNCLCWGSILIFFVLFLIAGIAVLTWYLVLKADDPEFTITELQVKKSKASSSSKHKAIEYHFTIKAVNPNVKMTMQLEDRGGTSLSHDQKDIAKGKFPSDKLDEDESDVIKFKVKGTDASLPSEVQESIVGSSTDEETGSEKKKTPVSLQLNIRDLQIHIKYGSVKQWDMKAQIECKFKVDTLGSGTKILEQECEETLK